MFNLKKQKIILIRGEEDVEHENLMKRKIFDDEQELANSFYFYFIFQSKLRIKLEKKKQALLYKFRIKGFRKPKKLLNLNLIKKSFQKKYTNKRNWLLRLLYRDFIVHVCYD